MEPIRSIYADDPDMMEIVVEFAQEAGDRATSVESCLASEQYKELQTLAHQLKGAGGGYGFPQITDAAAKLEQAVKDGSDMSAIKESSQELCAILRAVEVVEQA